LETTSPRWRSRNAVKGVAQACVPDPDGMLRDLLVQAIDECAAWAGHDSNRGAAVDTALSMRPCRRTGGVTAADATTSDELRERALAVR
jgi:hypothetical protein